MKRTFNTIAATQASVTLRKTLVGLLFVATAGAMPGLAFADVFEGATAKSSGDLATRMAQLEKDMAGIKSPGSPGAAKGLLDGLSADLKAAQGEKNYKVVGSMNDRKVVDQGGVKLFLTEAEFKAFEIAEAAKPRVAAVTATNKHALKIPSPTGPKNAAKNSQNGEDVIKGKPASSQKPTPVAKADKPNKSAMDSMSSSKSK